jgi:hypothetical protein
VADPKAGRLSAATVISRVKAMITRHFALIRGLKSMIGQMIMVARRTASDRDRQERGRRD